MTADWMPAPRVRRGVTVVLCGLLSLLLGLLIARRAWGLRDLGGFGVPVTVAVTMAAQLALAAGALVLLARTRRTGLPGPALAVLATAAATAGLLLSRSGDPPVRDWEFGWLSYAPLDAGAYSSTLTLSFNPELRPGTAVLVVAVLGLLPVAGLLALLPGRALALPRRLRTATLVAAVLAALLVLRDLDRALALRELLQWRAQQFDLSHAVTAIAAVWALVGLLLSANAVARRRAGAVAVALPYALLIGWGALLLADPPLPSCCYGVGQISSDANVFRDYGVLIAAMAVGLLPLLVGQLRRVISTASTPPG